MAAFFCFNTYLYINNNFKMKKKINESQLRNIVRESIKRALMEHDYDEYQLDGPEGYGVDDDTYYDGEYDGLGLESGENEKKEQMRRDWDALDSAYDNDDDDVMNICYGNHSLNRDSEQNGRFNYTHGYEDQGLYSSVPKGTDARNWDNGNTDFDEKARFYGLNESIKKAVKNSIKKVLSETKNK